MGSSCVPSVASWPFTVFVNICLKTSHDEISLRSFYFWLTICLPSSLTCKLMMWSRNWILKHRVKVMRKGETGTFLVSLHHQWIILSNRWVLCLDGWRNQEGLERLSVVKNTCYSFLGLGFSSQHPSLEAYNGVQLQLKGLWSFLASVGNCTHLCLYTQI